MPRDNGVGVLCGNHSIDSWADEDDEVGLRRRLSVAKERRQE